MSPPIATTAASPGAEVIRGVIPVAPTVFADDETLDLDGQRRVTDFAIDAGSDAVCVLANYSEQFSLTDAERDDVLDATLEQVAGRIPVVVATSHFSSRTAAERSRRAQERGAAMVMLMPPFFGATMKVGPDAVVEYFKRVADGLDIDVMIQDAPLSTTPLDVPLLLRLAAEIPQVRYVKVEMPRTADKVRALVSATAGDAGADLPGIYDGEEAITLIPDLHAGVEGTMSSCLVPERLGHIVRTFHFGSRDEATADWESLLPLIHFENRQCGLSATKILMKEGGIIASDRTRAPLDSPGPETTAQLIALAKRHDPLVLRWA